jgi:hypothetical protein
MLGPPNPPVKSRARPLRTGHPHAGVVRCATGSSGAGVGPLRLRLPHAGGRDARRLNGGGLLLPAHVHAKLLRFAGDVCLQSPRLTRHPVAPLPGAFFTHQERRKMTHSVQRRVRPQGG